MTCIPWKQRKWKDPEDNINHQDDKSFEKETGMETILHIVLEIHKTEIEGCQEGLIGLWINLELILMIDQNDRTRNVKHDSKQQFNRHCEHCDQDGYTLKYCGRCKPMQRNVWGIVWF